MVMTYYNRFGVMVETSSNDFPDIDEAKIESPFEEFFNFNHSSACRDECGHEFFHRLVFHVPDEMFCY